MKAIKSRHQGYRLIQEDLDTGRMVCNGWMGSEQTILVTTTFSAFNIEHTLSVNEAQELINQIKMAIKRIS